MINRANYLHVRAYLAHTQRVRQHEPTTVKRNRGHLRHLLEWADETLLTDPRSLDPFPAYLVEKRLAPATIAKTLTVARQFFNFMRADYPLLYKRIKDSWIESLQPPRSMRPQSRLQNREYYTLEHVQKIASLQLDDLHLQRAQTAVCMLFLSGMRTGALASIPIHCVDVANLTLRQLPEFGVRTKGHKAAITYLMPIPDVLQVVKRWDALLSVFQLPPDALWYATIARDNSALTATTQAFRGRHNAVQRDIKRLCETHGIPYLNPHKLRHGFVVHAVKKARNMRELKAISQNVMHASVVITDQVYGRLVGDDIQEVINTLA
jgi:site-specific recombinase XerC